MGFKIKNSLTGEFEKLPILTLKGEKGETGGVEEYNKVDYMGNKYETLKQANDANVEYAVKTAIGEFNYLDYEGQHITALDTIAGQAKNAVVKGNTLVNLIDYSTVNNSNNYTIIKNNDVITITSQVSRAWIRAAYNLNITHDKKYIVMWDSLEYTQTSSNGITNLIGIWGFSDNGSQYEVKAIKQGQTGNYLIFSIPNTSPINLSKTTVRIHATTDVAEIGATTTIKGLKVIEYQEGMENWDIPYFEGMASVQMPVLKTTGKNLVNVDRYTLSCGSGAKLNNHKNTVITKNIKVKPNTKYTFSYGKTVNVPSEVRLKVMTLTDMIEDEFNVHVDVYSHKNRIKEHSVPNGGTFTTESHAKYIAITTGNFTTTGDILIEDIQIEEGSAATPFEPYKSNILTTPEDLELRGIGDVKDELNLMTGELTQRIGEIVFNSSDGFHYLSNQDDGNFSSFGFIRDINRKSGYNGEICDKLKRLTNYLANENGIYYYGNDGRLELRLDTTNFISRDLNGLNDYLSKNPITVQYFLATPTIKTVDLSDNHVYSYKDITHYDCSSAEGSLVPTLSVKVPTDVQATIAQQRETIQTLNSENERLNQIQEALKASMLDSQVQLMNLSWNTDFEVFTLRESIAPKDFLLASRTGSNIDKFGQAKFIIENDCPDLEKLNSQIEYYFSKNIFSQEQFEELTDLISIVKGENSCEY